MKPNLRTQHTTLSRLPARNPRQRQQKAKACARAESRLRSRYKEAGWRMPF